MLYDKIKKQYTEARKERNADVGVLSVLLGDIEKVGKDKRNGAPTDDEVMAVLKKMIKNAQIMSSYANATAEVEMHLLQSFLPKQLTLDELRSIAKSMATEGTVTMADMMKHLKTNFANQYDSKMVAEALK